jgi:PAS domain S-box-containing protein
VGLREDDEDKLLRSVALQNANSILRARQRAEQQLLAAQKALRESAERLQLALSAGRLGDWSWDANTDVVTLGPRAAEIFGLLKENAITWAGLRELLHEDDREGARIAVGHALAQRGDYSLEYRVRRPSGELCWVATHGRGNYTESGSVLGMTGVVEDITERKHAQEALNQSQARLQMAVEAGQMGDWEWTIPSGKVHWSPALEAVHGLPAGGFGGGFDDFQRDMHPEDRERVLATIQRCVEERQGYRIEYRIIKPDGTLSWIEARGKLYLDDQGRPARMTGICMDVTQRKQADETLRDETRILELLNKTGTTLSSKLELQALIQAVTDAATALSGAKFGAFFYNTTDETGESFMLYALSGASRAAFAKFGRPRSTPLFGPTFKGENSIRCDDVLEDPRYGRMKPHDGMPQGHLSVRSYLAVPVISRSGGVIGGLFFGHPEIGIFTERTERLIAGVAAQAAVAIDNARLYESAQRAAEERKQLLESERSARSAAERMSEMKDEFLATLSHELRTPLSAILGWSQILRRGVKSDADLQKGLDTIERNARVQTRLIEDLLDMSRIASGKVRLDIQPVEPVAFIEAAIETVRPAADAKGIRLEKLLDPTAGSISGDPGRLQQVVWNLLSNAIKFTSKGGKVQVVLERVQSHIEISVADTGVGIKPEFLANVFERFRQADASTTRTHGGLGLGLSIVKNLVELHGGTVRVQSEGEGRGATFAVQLPVTVVHSGPYDASRLHPKTPSLAAPDFRAIDLSGIKVLVVDDEPDARELIRRVLSDCAAEVITAGTAADALELVRQYRPHVLVSDIGMPDVDGFELLRRIRALGDAGGGRLPAIALTAFARSQDRTRALRAGFLVHVSKPVEASELIATVATVAGRTGEPAANDRSPPPT